MNTIPQRPPAAELQHYLSDHTIDQASRRWNVNPRTIHKWKARADTPHATVLAQDERNTPTTIDSTPTFSPTADDVAGDHSMWRDPWTGELLPVPPGVHRKVWEAERIAARDRHKTAVESALAPLPQSEAPCPMPDTMSSQAEETASETTDIDTADDGAPAHALPMPLQSIAPQRHETRMPGMGTYAPGRIVIRERVEVGMVAWVHEHPEWRNQILAWVFVLALIYVSSWG